MHIRNRLALAGGVAAFAALSGAVAQESLDVRVVGADNAPLAGITVLVENERTGRSETATTDATGRARLGPLATGSGYRVTAGNAADETVASAPFRIRSGIDASVSLVLAMDSVDTLVVRGQRSFSALNTTNAEVSATLSADEIDKLPVEARSLERVLFRLPSVTQSTGFFGEAPSVAINGANALFTNYTIDGLDNNENFLGGQRFAVPIGAVADVTVLSSTYSAEFGRTANGVVNVTTPSGGNEFKGEIVYVTRPADFLQADPSSTRTSLFGAPVSDTFSRNQGALVLSGPIVRDQTFFFLNAEYVLDRTDNILSVPALGVEDTIEGTNEQILLTARIDHDWSADLRSTLRVNHGRVNLERQGGGLAGGTTFPSAGSVQDRYSTNIALTNSYSGAGFDYVGSFQYSRFDWDFGEPIGGAGPQVTLFGQSPDGTADTTRPLGTIGSPGFIFDETENTFQVQQKVSWRQGRHDFKVGLDYINASFDLFGGGNVDGNFTVALTDEQIAALSGVGSGFGVDDLPGSLDIENAAFETQPNAFGETQEVWSFFAEDQVQITDDLSVTVGVRYDYDTLTEFGGDGGGDSDNISPRLGFNYTPRADIAIRGGVGRYVEKLPYAVISDAIGQGAQTPAFIAQLEELRSLGGIPGDIDVTSLTRGDGNATVTVTDQCGDTIASCPAISTLGDERDALTFAERRVFNPFGLDNPEAIQASLGAEWEAAPDLYLGIDAQYTRGRNLLRLIDLNAPSPFDFDEAAFLAGVDPQTLVRDPAEAEASRPTQGVSRIIASDTGGESEYQALIFKIRKGRGDGIYDANIFYTLSRLENDTDDINFRSNDANQFDADFGPSLNDRTHVISAFFNLYPVDNLVLNASVLAQSGQPINFVPNPSVFGTTDLNGDGFGFETQFTGNPDRFPLEDRNSGRLPWAATVDLGAAYTLDAPGIGEFEVRADLFNALNTEVESGFPVNFTASNQIQTFGQPTVIRSVGQPRTFQFTARYAF